MVFMMAEYVSKEDVKKALALWGDAPGTILDYMIESGGSVGHTSKVCERCNKPFRFWRKRNIIFDRSAHKFHHWKEVCIDCINMETDAF